MALLRDELWQKKEHDVLGMADFGMSNVAESTDILRTRHCTILNEILFPFSYLYSRESFSSELFRQVPRKVVLGFMFT